MVTRRPRVAVDLTEPTHFECQLSGRYLSLVDVRLWPSRDRRPASDAHRELSTHSRHRLMSALRKHDSMGSASDGEAIRLSASCPLRELRSSVANFVIVGFITDKDMSLNLDVRRRIERSGHDARHRAIASRSPPKDISATAIAESPLCFMGGRVPHKCFGISQ